MSIFRGYIMYIVEIGLLHHERPLLQVSFYRTDEELNDATIQKIIIGIYSIVPEIFKNQVLKRLIVAKKRKISSIQPISCWPTRSSTWKAKSSIEPPSRRSKQN